MSLKYQTKRTEFRLRHYRHGDYHKVNGPALTWELEEMEWYQYGEPHRLDGPARTSIRSSKAIYFLRGAEYTKKQYESKIRSY